MSALYLYGLLETPPEASVPGLRGEPVQAVRCGPLLAAVGEMDAAPELAEEWLRAHDDAVRRLMAATPALLPARFGTFVAGPVALCEALSPRSAALAEATALVRGCAQMTLRLFGSGMRPAEGSAPDDVGPGTRYLAERAARQAPDVPEAAALRERLSPWTRAEKGERHDRPPLLASLHHLVLRRDLGAYAAALEDARAEVPSLRVVVSGPWPPYAFAPEVP